VRQRKKTGRYGNGAERHHRARPVAVDRTANSTRNDAHREQRDGKAEKDEAAAPTRVPTDRPREDSEAVVAGSPGGDLREAQGENRAHHGIAKSRAPAGALVRVRCVTHKPRPATRARLPVPMSLAK
jgi:hypothetical protein